MITNKIRLIVIALLLLPTGVLTAQSSNQIDLEEVIKQFQKEKDITIFYSKEWVEGQRVPDIDFSGYDPVPYFTEILSGSGLRIISYNSSIFAIIDPKGKLAVVTEENDTRRTSNLVTFGTPGASSAEKLTINGRVKDGETGDDIVGATVAIEELSQGMATNIDGFYSLSLSPGKYTITYKFVGYETERRVVNLYDNGNLDIELFSRSETLEEIVVHGRPDDENINNAQFGSDRLTMEQIKSIPAFLGEADVIKSLILLPGVSTVGEGSSGFNVRGGNVDQNLILQDEAMIFNSSHVFGFFSAFNSEIVDEATLYKGSIPAEYGGRASSILNVNLRDGNRKEIAGTAGVGPVSAKMALEGPIVRDKSSFVIGARSSYSDWLLNNMPTVELRNSSASFGDLNVRATTDVGKNSKLTVSLYGSTDAFSFDADTTYNWNTVNGSVNYSRIFSDKVYGSFIFAKGRYSHNIDDITGLNQFNLSSSIDFDKAKMKFSYSPGFLHNISFGVEAIRYRFSPGNFQPVNNSYVDPKVVQNENGLELAGYVSDEWSISSKFSVIGGFRYSAFLNYGPRNVNLYLEGESKREETITGVQEFGKNDLIQSYYGFEPRLSFKYSLDAFSSIKASYGISNQYLHLISNTAAVTPVDVWKLSDKYIEPLRATQLSLGYFRNFNNNSYETSAEVYYKKLDNIVEYIDHADLLLNQHLETDVLNAVGNSYGAEFFLKKIRGRLNGWLSYTYSRSFRTVAGQYQREVVNNGNPFPANYDKPHDVTLVGNYKISRRYSFSFNFTYSTGRPVTAPLYRYQAGNLLGIDEYSFRNQLRIPDYHRLDLSLIMKTSLKKSQLWESSWVFSVYNAYSRMNAYSVFYRQQYPAGPYKLSVIGTIFPSVTYNIKF